jgi:hypothetical protein
MRLLHVSCFNYGFFFSNGDDVDGDGGVLLKSRMEEEKNDRTVVVNRNTRCRQFWIASGIATVTGSVTQESGSLRLRTGSVQKYTGPACLGEYSEI